MPEPNSHDALSFGDALFLYLERPGMPLHIASVSVFEGDIPLPACARFIESKLPLIPRYRQRVVIPPFNLGLPAWEYCPDFDVRNHVRQMRLKRGTDAEFKAAVATVLSANMDRSLPLWDFTLVHGLKGHRTGVVLRVHHCLADGLAGISLLNTMLDPIRVSHPLPRRIPLPPIPKSGGSPDLLDSLVNAWSTAVQQVLTVHSELLSFTERFVGGAGGNPVHPQPEAQSNGDPTDSRSLLEEWSRYLPELAGPAKRLPFNVVCRGPQKFHWAEIAVDEVKAVKQAAGATFNDVALAAIALAVRRYAVAHGVQVKDRNLKIVVPVNVRGIGDLKELGNRISFVPISVPLGIADPGELLADIRQRMARLKSTHLAELVGFAGTLIGAIPNPVQALLGPIASQLPLSICNLIFTNVRGPESPLYLMGHKMLSCCPYVPIGGEMGMNCAMLTYNGTAYFGFTGDVHAVPDLGRFERLLTTSFAELRKGAGLGVSRRKAARAKAKWLAEPAGAPPARITAPEAGAAGVPALAPRSEASTPEPPAAPQPLAKAAAA